ncbi:MAG TPA: hypothetical protein DCF44_08460 [Chitinophagaceae bacterium]|nr:hypothetical protein [Chitinophagaceae bacterium]
MSKAFVIILLILQLTKLVGHNDTIVENKYFISINLRGGGVIDHVEKKSFSHLVIVTEAGYWLKRNLLVGVSSSLAFNFGDMGYKYSYQPFEINLLSKYFPFKHKKLKWLGVQTQLGFSNSCMEPFSMKKKLYLTPSIGPATSFKFNKIAFNFNFLFYSKHFINCPVNLNIAGLKSSVRPYLGFSYSF